jgi:hypothetical protein
MCVCVFLPRPPGSFKSGMVTAGAGTVLRSLVLGAQVRCAALFMRYGSATHLVDWRCKRQGHIEETHTHKKNTLNDDRENRQALLDARQICTTPSACKATQSRRRCSGCFY